MGERQGGWPQRPCGRLPQNLLGTPGWQGWMETLASALAAWRPWSRNASSLGMAERSQTRLTLGFLMFPVPCS